jgi:Asp-tRNA(Asn)/Glu-tRNA(Gln) amidotransferase A subunit family amidase
VMSAIARPDGRDLSVADIPFNWDAGLDVRSLKVGYLADAFADEDRDPEWQVIDTQTIAKLEEMGFDLVPLEVPDFPTDVLRLSVESAVFHDELLRSGLYKEMTNKSRGERMRTARLIPAVEYLQSQRMRAMMMRQLAKATAAVDVYVTPSTHGSPRREGDRDANNAPELATQRHSQMANLACYPAVALPSGFLTNGAPTSVSFMAQPYREAALLAVTKAYQDATDFHRQQPPLFAAS